MATGWGDGPDTRAPLFLQWGEDPPIPGRQPLLIRAGRSIKAPPVRHRQLPLDDSDLSAKWLSLALFQSKEQALSEERSELNTL